MVRKTIDGEFMITKVEEYVTITDFCNEIGIDKSNIAKVLEKLEIYPKKMRHLKAGNQYVRVLNKEEIKKIKNYRSDFHTINAPSEDGSGFYLIKIDPLMPSRVKFGYSDRLDNRVLTYRTICPNLEVIKTWKCERIDETTVIRMATKNLCLQISKEVFDLNDGIEINSVIERLDKIFEML